MINKAFFRNLCMVNLRRLISAIIGVSIGYYLLTQGLNVLEIFIAELVPATLVFIDWYITDCHKKRELKN